MTSHLAHGIAFNEALSFRVTCRALAAMLKTGGLDVAALERAYRGG